MSLKAIFLGVAFNLIPALCGCNRNHAVPIGADGATEADLGPSQQQGDPVLLASAIAANDIVIDGNGLYLLNAFEDGGGEVLRLSKIDGARTILASGLRIPSHMAGDESDLYFATYNAVQSVAKAGGPLRTVSGATEFLALDRFNLYWSWSFSGDLEHPQPTESKLFSLPKSGGAPTVLLSGNGTGNAMAVDTAGLFFEAQGSLQVLEPGAGQAKKLADLPAPYPWLGTIALDETDAYLGGHGGVMRVSKQGGTPSLIANVEGISLGIALDATHVYFTDTEKGTVVKVPKGGGAAETLASGQARPVSVAVDDTTVYWANINDHTIMKVAK